MKNKYYLLAFVSLISSCFIDNSAVTTIRITATSEDITTQLRDKIEAAECENLKIIFDKGVYNAKPDFATERYCPVTNHQNGVKKILFPISKFKSIEIDGNGSEIICHGNIFPFLFEDCSNVKVSNITIDWDIPFLFLAEVIATNPKEGWREIRPLTEGYSWTFSGDKIMFPNIDGFNYETLGNTLPFNPETKRIVPGAIDSSGRPTKVEKQNNGIYRLYEKLRFYPPVGSLLNSKGGYHDRYSPCFDFKECKNITIDNVTIHHALGMGFLFERSEDITIKNSRVVVRDGSNRVVSSTADATHFANCKGDILIEDCRFENMLDDGTNVHGTYVEVTQVTAPNRVIVTFGHEDQVGFVFAKAGDEVWQIIAPSPSRHSVNSVEKVRIINEKYIELTFTKNIPIQMKKGDIIENKTWNPTFTMRGCTIQNNRARSVILKTPLKTIIENNNLSSMMSSIQFRGETFSWFESGAVEDVIIRNNFFKNGAECGTTHAVLYITPRLGKQFDETIMYDKNIVFENNIIDSYIPRIVIADRAEGMIIRNNTIIKNKEGIAPFPNAPLFDFTNCKDVIIEGNIYKGDKPFHVLSSDKVSKQNIKILDNTNLIF